MDRVVLKWAQVLLLISHFSDGYHFKIFREFKQSAGQKVLDGNTLFNVNRSAKVELNMIGAVVLLHST